MFRVITLGLVLLTSVTFSQEKKLWAKSYLNKKGPEIVVEKWLNGEPDLQGKFILIDYWATWCRPCLGFIPELNNYNKKFADKLVIIGISNETEGKVDSFTSPKIEYYKAIDSQGRMYKELEVKGIPHVILIDPDGIVRWEGFPALEGFELTEKVISDIISKYSK
jgi:thiol-disulfide isomerase/thioredoxin